MLSAVSRLMLRVLGWRSEGQLPDEPKLVIIVAPHTSNWDLPIVLLFEWALRARCNYLGKHSLFWWPLGWILRATGGIPVIRHERHNVVEQLSAAFATRERLWLAMAPSGTRSLKAHWRSGFYHLTLAAKVPLLPIALDFGRKTFRLGELLQLSGDMDQDMGRLRQFYEGVDGLRPELHTPIRLPAEALESR